VAFEVNEVAICWKGVRKDYEEKGESPRELADKYNCHPSSIRRRAKKEGWTMKGKGSGKGGRKGCEARCPERLSADVWRGVKERLIKGLEESDAKKGLEELKVAKMAREVITSMLRETDDLADDGFAEDALKVAEQMARLTVPPGTGKAMEGE